MLQLTYFGSGRFPSLQTFAHHLRSLPLAFSAFLAFDYHKAKQLSLRLLGVIAKHVIREALRLC